MKGPQNHLIDAPLRALNFQMSCFAFCDLILVFLYNEICFDRNALVFNESVQACPGALYFKIACWVLYLIVLQRLYVYYKLKSAVEDAYWHYGGKLQAFWKSKLWIRFLIEAFVNSLQPLPVPNNWGFENNIVISFTIFRLYLFLRLLRDYSSVFIHRYEIRETPAYLQLCGLNYEIDFLAVFKTYFYNYTIPVIASSFLFVILWLSYLIYLTEREWWIAPGYDPLPIYKVSDHDGELPPSDFIRAPTYVYGNCIWFVIVTMATLGYGDIYPHGWQGRIYATTSCILGVIYASLLVGALTNMLAPNEFERVVLNWLEKDRASAKAQYYAARTIQTAWREHHSLKKMDVARKKEIKIRRIRSTTWPWIRRLRASLLRLRKLEKNWRDSEAEVNNRLLDSITRVHKQLGDLVTTTSEQKKKSPS